MHIKTFLAVIALATGYATSAHAADLYTPPPTVAANWSGPYAGFFLGAGVDQDNSLATGAASQSSTASVTGGGVTPGQATGICLNTASNSPANPALDTKEKCEGKGHGNPPHVFIEGVSAADVEAGVVTFSSDSDSDAGKDAFDDAQFLGGLVVGYNLQRAMNGVVFVYGVEADFTWMDNDSLRSSTSAVGNGAAITAASSGGSGVDWFGTVRGRLGYSMWENFLPFITGGLAYGEVDTEGRVKYSGQLLGQSFNKSFSFGDSDVEFGWTAGAGFDYLIRRSANGVGSGVVVNFTWLYVDLDDDHSAGNSFLATSQIGAQSALVSAATAENVDATFHVFRAGLSLKF